jgi:hypothetical protein
MRKYLQALVLLLPFMAVFVGAQAARAGFGPAQGGASSTQIQTGAVILDPSSSAIGVGGVLGFAGYATAPTSNQTTFAKIAGVKQNGTDANQTGALVFSTNTSGNVMTERGRFLGSGYVFQIGNGANTSTIRIFSDVDNAANPTNYERFAISKTQGGSCTIASEFGGTGSVRNIQFTVGATNAFYIDGSTGNLLWNTDATLDIGATGASRPHNIYVGGLLSIQSGSSTKSSIGSTQNNYSSDVSFNWYSLTDLSATAAARSTRRSRASEPETLGSRTARPARSSASSTRRTPRPRRRTPSGSRRRGRATP